MNQKEKILIHYQENHKEIDGKLYKRCSIHEEYSPNEEEWLLCTDEFFYKNKGSNDGLSPYCKTCEKKKNSQWGKNHRDKRANYCKKHDQNPKRKENLKRMNKEGRDKGVQRDWQRNNPNKMKEYRENREMHGNHKISKKEWINCKEYFNNECAYCGLSIEQHYNKFKGEIRLTDFHKEHVDHEGNNDLSNCIPSCKICNSSKHTSLFDEWYNKDNPNFSSNRLNKIHKWLHEDYKLYIKATN